MISKGKILLACDEANHVCDKNQYKEASLLEKIKLNIHLIYCRACRKYSSNNGKLTNILKKSNINYLKKNEKEEIREKFEKAIDESHSN